MIIRFAASFLCEAGLSAIMAVITNFVKTSKRINSSKIINLNFGCFFLLFHQ